MIFKLSLVAVAAVAAIVVSSFSTKTDVEEGEKVTDCVQDKELKEKEEVAAKDMESDSVDVIRGLEEEIGQRKVKLEMKLLQLYGLKEKRFLMTRLGRELEEKDAKIVTLKVSINSLQANKTELKKEIGEAIQAEKQLEMANKMLGEMKEKLHDNEDSAIRAQLVMLNKKVSTFGSHGFKQKESKEEGVNEMIQDLVLEKFKLRRINKEVELDKRNLAVKLVDAGIRVTNLSDSIQSKIAANPEEDMRALRISNDELSEQIERLQEDRFRMVEELVYQKWLQVCLRFEIQMNQTQSRNHSDGKHESRRNTSKLTLDCGFETTSSPTSSSDSTINESNNTIESSSTSSSSSSIKDENDMNDVTEPILSQHRRFSTSMLPSNSSIASPKTSRGKKKRVSFSDSVELAAQDKTFLHNKETGILKNSKTSKKQQTPSAETTIAKKPDIKNVYVDMKLQKLGKNSRSEDLLQLTTVIAVPSKAQIHKKNNIVQTLVVFLFLISILLAYFSVL